MILEEALMTVMDNPVHNRNYVYAKRPFTLDSPSFISGRTTLWWSDHTGDVQIVGYVKDIRHEFLRFSQVADDIRDALERLVTFYEEKEQKR